MGAKPLHFRETKTSGLKLQLHGFHVQTDCNLATCSLSKHGEQRYGTFGMTHPVEVELLA